MPPKVRVTKEAIVAAAADVVRSSGAELLNARAVAQRMGVSTQPIFSNYESMDDLRADVIDYAEKLYMQYIEREISSGKYPPYKSSGMAYICFAREERELFKMLFMCDRSDTDMMDESESFVQAVELVQKNLGIDRDTAEFFHLEAWVFVHGIATLYATSYLDLDMQTVSIMVTDVYNGLRAKFLTEGKANE